MKVTPQELKRMSREAEEIRVYVNVSEDAGMYVKVSRVQLLRAMRDVNTETYIVTQCDEGVLLVG